MRIRIRVRWLVVASLLLTMAAGAAWYARKAYKASIPHGQERPPGKPLSPLDALKAMVVPPGFQVELVASEPAIVNPLAMTFDDQGRIWITESVDYPRSTPGAGQDCIKVLESTRGDGVFDRVTVFAEGLSIPSGIAVGHGGVWVAQAPDILFFKVGADGKAAGKPEVVVSGFGPTDTHAVPNSLTWGPDGWLYGLNGVYNQCHVKHQGKEQRFSCALFRIHPRTRAFQVFAEGTSNPWGLTFDGEGSAFVAACIVDHLWHFVETGQYEREGGVYPAFAWKLGSMVQHKHQQAAYAGLLYFDSDAFPPEYRERFYLANLHGNCINVDVPTRAGASYVAGPAPDFLTTADAWFMPMALKMGPDGCLYILDWYDRYHCPEDAQRDSPGVDRTRGRLYRVRYGNSPPAPKFDLAAESDEQLLGRLSGPNSYYRETAQRLLAERNSPAANARLQNLVLDEQTPRKTRMHALWALVGTGRLDSTFHRALLGQKDAGLRAWGVRAAGNMGQVDPEVRNAVAALAADPAIAPEVQLQLAIAAPKLANVDAVPLLTRVLAASGGDPVITGILWENLHPLLEERGDQFLMLYEKADAAAATRLTPLLPRVVERILAGQRPDAAVIAALFGLLVDGGKEKLPAATQCLHMLAGKVQTGELAGGRLEVLRERLQPTVRRLTNQADHPLALDAALLAATLQEPAAFDLVRRTLAAADRPAPLRLRALDALVTGGDPQVLDVVAGLLADRKGETSTFRGEILGRLNRSADVRVAVLVIEQYPRLEPELQPRAIELLTQRASWSKQLLAAIEVQKVAASALNVNQVRNLLAFKDEELTKLVTARWGTLREERNPEREKVVARMRDFLTKTRGDPIAGWKVFRNVCGQCHKIYGEGQDVGPDITANGRADFEQLLSNVLDPSLVIGANYQATTVLTTKGQVLTGLLVEDNAQRIVLKVQGGKLETVPRDNVEEKVVGKISIMPENLEQQIKPQEIADLFAFLCLDKPPTDPAAKPLAGAPRFK